jgi:glutaredoxin 3
VPKIDIYTTPMCPYCHAAKRLLDQKGAAYDEIGVMMRPERRREMETRSGGSHTVPQIFIGDVHVGGCDELCALDQQGGLDSLLTDAG